MERDQLRELLTQAVDAGLDALAASLAEAMPPAGPAGPVRMVPLDQLVVRPDRYQFRVSPLLSNAGTDGRLRGCSQFRRELAGVVLAWEEPGGAVAIVDGHHRYELARRSGVQDLAVLLIEAGSVREARRIGAMANLAAGNATPADVARLLRDEAMTPAEVVSWGVSARSTLLRDAAALVDLAPDLFGLVCTGEMELPMALALASAGSTIIQRDLAREAERRRWSSEQVAEAASLARMATVTSSTPSATLPGLEALLQAENSDLGTLLSIRSAIRRALSGELRALQAVARKRSAQSLEAMAVAVVDVDAAVDARDSSRATMRLFDRLSGLCGPLQQVIRRLADQVAATGRSAAEVVSDNLPAIREAIEGELK